MPTLRRILKYTPAAAMGLLVVAWVASLFSQFGACAGRERQEPEWQLGFVGGSAYVSWTRNRTADGWLFFQPRFWEADIQYRVGILGIQYEMPLYAVVLVPIPVCLTALLPLAIGPFLTFRFRLWHYMAYTAAVAVELAYYLRWQG